MHLVVSASMLKIYDSKQASTVSPQSPMIQIPTFAIEEATESFEKSVVGIDTHPACAAYAGASFALKLKPAFLQFYMCASWDAASGLPKSELDAIRAAGGPRAGADDQHKIQWYSNMARKLYPRLVRDDPRDEATFQNDYAQMQSNFDAHPEWRDFIQNKQVICAQTDPLLRADYMRAFDALRLHGAGWASHYQAARATFPRTTTTYATPGESLLSHHPSTSSLGGIQHPSASRYPYS